MTKTKTTATQEGNTVEKKARLSVKDKARRHIERLASRHVLPLTFEAVLTAYAAVGIIKYDEVLEMSDSYSATYIDNMASEEN